MIIIDKIADSILIVTKWKNKNGMLLKMFKIKSLVL